MWKENYELTPAERLEHERKNGGYNEFPPHWCEIDAAVFARSRHFAFSPVLVEYRQMRRPFGKPAQENTNVASDMVDAHLFWQQNGTGYAVVNDYWAKTVKFYTFGSVPEGYVEHFDSSD